MKPWMAIVIGIIIGWIIGWLFEMWWRRRRSAGETPTRTTDVHREIELPRPAASEAAVSSAALLVETPAATPTVEDTAAAIGDATAEDLTESEHEAPPEVNWQELYEEVQERTVEIAPEIDRLPAIGAEFPEVEVPTADSLEHPSILEGTEPARLPESALEALVSDSPSDDLIIIEGIGPVYAAKLNAAGIGTFARLAECTPEELDAIIQAPSWRKMYFSEWIEQAQLLRDKDEVRLRELQERLFRRKKG